MKKREILIPILCCIFVFNMLICLEIELREQKRAKETKLLTEFIVPRGLY